MKKVVLAWMIVLALTTFAVASIAPTSWDITSDFALNSNPHNQWQYGCADSLGGTFNLFTTQSTRGWTTDQGLPSIWKNDTGYIRYGVAVNAIGMLPGTGSQVAILRWTAPQSGTYSIATTFFKGDIGLTTVSVLVNNASIYSQTSSDTDLTFTQTISLQTNGTIDFALGNYDSVWDTDNTGISAVITQVPEPITACLLLAGTCLLRKR